MRSRRGTPLLEALDALPWVGMLSTISVGSGPHRKWTYIARVWPAYPCPLALPLCRTAADDQRGAHGGREPGWLRDRCEP